MNIYLAGKISRVNDWRERLVPHIQYNNEDWLDLGEYPSWNITKGILYGHDFTGPYFIKNGREKYGEMHRVTVNDHCYPGNNGAEEKFIFEQCLMAIEKSDAVFAYIDSNECFGTIAEVGYAFGINKLVGLCYENDILYGDVWFLKNMADYIDADFQHGIDVYESLKRFIVFTGHTLFPKFAGFPTYQEYLNSEHWQEVRKKALEHYRHACVLDRRHTAGLNVHHNNYDNLGNETMADVIVLCRDCHAKYHEKVV